MRETPSSVNVRRRPLVGLAALFILGTWCGVHLQSPVALPLGLCVTAFGSACVAAWAWRRRAARCADTVAAAAILLGCGLLAWLSAALVSDGVRSEGANFRVSGRCTVEGIVEGDPQARTRGGQDASTFCLRVERLRIGDGGWRDASGNVDVLWFGNCTDTSASGWSGNLARGAVAARRPERVQPRYGDRWRMEGELEPDAAAGSSANGRQLRKAHARLVTSRRRASLVSEGHGSPFVRWCLSARRRAGVQVTRGITDFPVEAGLLQALLLGYRSRMGGELRDVFAAVGTLHIFAISGLHVGIICGLIISVLRAFRVPRGRWILFLAPLLAGYTVATGAKPSAVRACLMAGLYFLAPLLQRRPDGLSALAVAAVLILGVSPLQIVDTGFIYSFTVVLGLIVLYPRIHARIRRLYTRDPLQVTGEGTLVRATRYVAERVGSLLALSISAWLVSAPMSAHFFGRFSPIAIAGNVIVVPVAFLVVVCGSLSMVLGSCVEWLSHVFNHASLGLIAFLVRFTSLLTGVPYGSLTFAPLGGWAVVAWYAVLGTGVAWWHARGEAQRPEDAAAMVIGPGREF